MATDTEPKKTPNRWIWVSVVLGVAAAGLLIWALTMKSDHDSTEKELASTTQQLDESQQQVEQLESEQATDPGERAGRAIVAAGGVGAVKAVYEDLEEQLGTTEDTLESTQKDLKAATKQAEAASAEAEAAKREASKADNAADKAKAETKQAQAEAQEAKSQSALISDCASAYLSAFRGLLESEDVEKQAKQVQKQFAGITDDCKGALAGA